MYSIIVSILIGILVGVVYTLLGLWKTWAMGIILGSDVPVHPPTPPPSVDLDAWRATLTLIGHIGPERFGATHFGIHDDPHGRREELRRALVRLEERVADALSRDAVDSEAEAFEGEVREALARWVPAERVDLYFDTFRPATDFHGVARYLETRSASGGDAPPRARNDA